MIYNLINHSFFYLIPNEKIAILKLFLMVYVSSYSQTDIITINPQQVKQAVTFGGDAKLTIKDYAEGNANTVSQKLFGDMNLRIFRIPIFALQPITDIKVVAFGFGNILDLHIINKNTIDNTVDLQLQNGFSGTGTVNRKIWDISNTGAVSTYNVNDLYNWSITVPANSYSHLKIPLNKSILNVVDLKKRTLIN